ncbi:MAG: hypothetical protein CO017_09965, partial [Zetaproteobacteria bacterium CG_4_8_14_3_um_filter_59_5]
MQGEHSDNHVIANGEHILVVDDDILTRNYLSLLLQRWGYQVVVASDLSSARKALHKSKFSLTLIDLMYPDDDASGYDLVDMVRVEQPECAVMIITSDHSAETAVEAIRLHVDDYFLKPVVAEELLHAVRRHIGGCYNLEGKDGEIAIFNLTQRERAVLEMFHKGCTYKETARVLGCGLATVQTHAKNL